MAAMRKLTGWLARFGHTGRDFATWQEARSYDGPSADLELARDVAQRPAPAGPGKG